MADVLLAADLRLHVYPRWRSAVRLLGAASAVGAGARMFARLHIKGKEF